MEYLEIQEEPSKDWNEFLLKSEFGTIYQTKEYAAYSKSLLKFKPKYMKFFDSTGSVIGQLLLFETFRGRRKTAKFFGRGRIYSCLSKIGNIFPQEAIWISGPVVSDVCNNKVVMKLLGDFIMEKKYKFCGSVHPLNNSCFFPESFNFLSKNLGTFLIDLKLGKEKIFKNSDKHSVQKNIERSRKRGVKITKVDNKKDLVTYYELLHEFRKANHLQPYSYEDVVKGYDFLKNVGQIGFLAWYDEIPIGGIFVSTFNGYINEWGIARSSLDSEKNLYSIDLLRWTIIEWGIENKKNYYDLSGVEIENRNIKEEGIFRNKKKWGAILIEYPNFKNF